jgi:hypothetical protein
MYTGLTRTLSALAHDRGEDYDQTIGLATGCGRSAGLPRVLRSCSVMPSPPALRPMIRPSPALPRYSRRSAGLIAGRRCRRRRTCADLRGECQLHWPRLPPVQITIECRSGMFYAAHLRYRKYGGASASATAELVQNICLPNCTDGMAIESPGTIKLSHVQSCEGRLYYERIAWKLIESRGHRSPHGSRTIKPRACGGA